ncbi:precorrin-4 C11-methyltransferase [Desulfofarcimen acetoxidans DSM 771]|uniref:Precorrin-4 C11-methyltransferase n=1 Tax=Desulfofarcimen acetoxidans (strain ATCC 49208 / DSM 771 / KCTC 5769 / VKM B-1644 / 5575) TaxID=485916 RepID=C8W687_DESAS|nr:precorrin-4 C(11)-methyltransferase [Desulfofarcimen acetoxidans]ACV62176.1 precorrin-4 C11-methyltransferase [Desulfofarcimen acetoxidans DSM 771]
MIYFVGAGPGDPELITVKGSRLLSEADMVVYTGSLVNPQVLQYCRPGIEIYNSAGMDLSEIISLMQKAVQEGKKVVRLQTGDPSLYGAIQEQMDALNAVDIPFTVIPGVSSFFAAAAAIPRELTLPGISQTVVLTRIEGRTPVPESEKLSELARHHCTMCIFLSVHLIDTVVQELLDGGYSVDTPVVIVERASWPEERVIKGTVSTISKLIKEAGITRTAMILVGQAFGADYQPSKLYDKNFAHGYRG